MVKKIALKIPPVLATLGRVVEIVADDKVYKFTKKDDVKLVATPDGKTLFCLAANKNKISRGDFLKIWQKNRKNAEKSVDLYEAWNEYEVQSGSIVTAPRGFLFGVGRCISLTYESDKWNGDRNQKYIHKFKSPPLLWVNKKTAPPTVLKLSGGKIRTTPRGITG